jgi:hypothetical protein
MKVLFILCLWGLALAALNLAGEADYQEALRQEKEYCEMVAAGTWPDYENKFDKVCVM